MADQMLWQQSGRYMRSAINMRMLNSGIASLPIQDFNLQENCLDPFLSLRVD